MQVLIDTISEVYYDPASEDVWLQTPIHVYLLEKPLPHYAPYHNALKLGLARISTEKKQQL